MMSSIQVGIKNIFRNVHIKSIGLEAANFDARGFLLMFGMSEIHGHLKIRESEIVEELEMCK